MSFLAKYRGSYSRLARDPVESDRVLRDLHGCFTSEELMLAAEEITRSISSIAMDETGSSFLVPFLGKLKSMNLVDAISTMFDALSSDCTADQLKDEFCCRAFFTMVILCPVLKDRLLSLLEDLFLQILMFGGLISPLLPHLFHHFTTQELQPLILKTSDNLHRVAYDRPGYQNVLQLLKESSTEFLFSLVSNLDHQKLDKLSRFTNGSSLLQFLVSSPVAELVMEKLYNSFLTLSMDKYGSFLVSHCLEHCHYSICLKIIEELTPAFSYLILHPYANFAIQAVIKRQWSIGLELHPLIHSISRSRHNELINSSIGKEVLKTLAFTYGSS